eukprot:scaffold101069_cov60-Phaeocystis_antarctica.AAC.1
MPHDDGPLALGDELAAVARVAAQREVLHVDRGEHVPREVPQRLRRRAVEEDAAQADPAHHGAVHRHALGVERVVAREAVARVEDEEEGEQRGGHRHDRPREYRQLDVVALEVEVQEEVVDAHQDPDHRSRQHHRHDRPSPAEQHADLIQLRGVVDDCHCCCACCCVCCCAWSMPSRAAPNAK